MNYYDSFLLNIYSLILLVILLISIFVKKEIYKESARLLRRLISFIVALLIIEMLSWTFDGVDTQLAYVLNYTFNLLFFITGLAAAGIFTSYVDYVNFGSKERLRKRFYYMHMFVFSIVLVIINFFTPVIFSIDSLNVYSREPFMVVGFATVYILIIHMFIQTFRNRKNLERGTFINICILLILPIVGGILQLLFFGLIIMWAFSGLGTVIAYIFNETTANSKDYLTKLYTREITYAYIDSLIQKNQVFTLIVIDIDNFKDINDSYGHQVGDDVLIHFAKILTMSFGEGSLVSRFGGDELVIVVKECSIEDASTYQELLEIKLSLYKKLDIMKKIGFSYGFSIRESDSELSIDNLLDKADKMMYNQKSEHKNLRRRATDDKKITMTKS